MGRFRYECKACAARVDQVEGNAYQCLNCGALYTLIKADDETPVGFIPKKREPLNLPRGSVRALTTIALSFTFLYQIYLYQNADLLLMQLLLTVIFYYHKFYFGSRN